MQFQNVVSVQYETPKDAEVALTMGVSGSPPNLLPELSHVPLSIIMLTS